MTDDPGEGYSMLAVGEIIQKGDEYRYFNKWYTTDAAGSNIMPGDIYRRKDNSKNPSRRTIQLYTTCNDLGVINGASVYASELPIPFENVVEIKVDPSTGTLYVEDWHGRPSGEA